ncbi:MAG: 50S ribosomal protein L7/L12 [bacterium]
MTTGIEEKKEQKFENIINAIASMNILEVSELVKALEEKFGVSAAMPMMVAASAGTGASAQPEEKTSFTCILTSSGDKKIQVIKEIRTITSLGLKESKDLVDGVPQTIKENVSKEEAEDIKKKIEDVGGVVEIK